MGFLENLRDDFVYVSGALRALRRSTPILKHPNRVFPDVIEDLAVRYGDAPALLSDRERLTYRELAARANRYARWALAHGVGKGDTVCLLMPNRPDYMAAWLGVTRAGGIAALVNTNLTGTSLAHCINIVAPKHVIVAAELLHAVEAVRPSLAGPPAIWVHGEAASDAPRIDRDVDARAPDPLTAAEKPALTIEDKALFIYTSGTTGLPKAANINHYRLMLAAHAFAGVMDARASDRMYNCLPMYHTTGGVVATGAMLVAGGCVVIRERFSAREFWDDMVRWECTVFQYIGELCRYLVNSPPTPNETRHKLRLACGNGLRPDVWPQFKQRFRIPQIVEFYAATEGNCSLFNFEGKEGAVGRLPWFMEHRFPIKVVRFDVEAEQPIRDANGFCVEAATDEPGEVIGKIINDPSKPGNRFEGYAEKAASERKILRNVFEKGDAWFRTGDLMRKDGRGYFYFVDRVGDTFRWKGENVSTSEVSQAMTSFPGIKDANVYGVRIPGYEGKAGMAAVVAASGIDLAALRAHLQQELPDYARPLLLRFTPEIDVTGTFKQKKIDLVREGYDPSVVTDAIFFNDPQAQSFVRLDKAGYDRLVSGGLRL
ncbi:MAG: long-chain-acyl-CoA synthetase [Variibacter sp.]